ncbi:MAG: tetratricopeptide repeat protein [Actinomycetales bacterium]|nr:tetratricopeptide repeat protein [Actinomycetales bacterium]
MADGRDMSRTAPLEWFAGRLRECRRRAGSPSLRALEELTQQLGRRYGRTSISDVLAAKSRPEWEFVESFVRACALFADASPTDLQRLDLDRWRQAHRRLLGELAYWRAGRRMASHAAAELRSTLPADVTPFVGRAEQLRTITRAITGQATSGGGAVSIHAIDGMPGVGKTALAVHVAHRVRNQFPDGQWFVDLHAHTPGLDPVRPADALTTLLLGDGADPGALPADLDARVAMWRDRTADKRALLILDNAVSSAQVEPLLPAGPGWLVLVTSRRHLGDLPAGTVPVPLDVLPPDQAERMFTTQAPGAAGDPAAVAELVALCGYLPLAVSLLARLSATHPTWTLGDLIAETRARLLTATAESSSVAAAFDLSYRALSPGRQRAFRHLALHPGTEFDPPAAAALLGVPLVEATGHLDALHGDHLLVERGYRRYSLHDLLRSYAGDLVATEVAADTERAVDRLFDHYQHAAALASAHMARQARPACSVCPAPAPVAPWDAVPEPVGVEAGPVTGGPADAGVDVAGALTWARTERHNLLACLARAADPRRVVALTAGLAELLRRDGPWADAVALHTAAATAARALGDDLARANALTDLGTVQRMKGDYPEAARALDEALDLYRTAGDRLGRANALTYLADVHRMTGDHARAIPLLDEALADFRAAGDRLGQADALTYLGIVRHYTGEYPHAEEALDRALDLYRDLGDRRGQANALAFLGKVRTRRGDGTGALDACLEALDLYRSLDSRLGQANMLCDLSVLRRTTGDLAGAVQASTTALDLYVGLAVRGGETEAHNELGVVHRLGGDLSRARAHHHRALLLAREAGRPWDEATALAGLGRCALASGDTQDAATRLGQALDLFRRIGAADAAGVEAELAGLVSD